METVEELELGASSQLPLATKHNLLVVYKLHGVSLSKVDTASVVLR